ncbi:DUF4258 domain-containing protein [Chitinophaga sancti]|uniref:DUF4258 domain-containing protein n=1 Tax=Chitinophaga sancti TaxID=1004 RepID=UPI002A763873|nr:DUF4258 domain-containing protein [Chitinophaga sancti]WPQ62468.1 DUF4258 domain-containing protein [Chitinophaga sancti]
MRSKGKYIPMLLLALLLVLAWQQQWWKGPLHRPQVKGNGTVERPLPNPVNDPSNLDRHARLTYTKHARCRMDCRQITEREVAEILETGQINTEKSNPRDLPCPTYALEGYSDDGQHLRIVFAPCSGETKVVTCIDLDKEWQCDCH